MEIWIWNPGFGTLDLDSWIRNPGFGKALWLQRGACGRRRWRTPSLAAAVAAAGVAAAVAAAIAAAAGAM